MTTDIREIQVETLGELVKEVTPTSPDPQSGRLRDCAVYRGLADATWHLLTCLDRLGTPDVPLHTKGHLEEHLLRNFIRYSRPHLSMPLSNEWEYLVVAQHHRLPTRLLDWTYSPLVAAHFATVERNPGANRVVWKVDWKRVHEHFNLPPLALTLELLDRVLREKGLHSPWELFNMANVQEELFLCMLEPPAIDARIVAQSATFTLSSDKTRAVDEILMDCGLSSAITRFIIPSGKVDYIRDQLDLCSVDERRLFPDLDGIAAEMSRYYSTSANEAARLAQGESSTSGETNL